MDAELHGDRLLATIRAVNAELRAAEARIQADQTHIPSWRAAKLQELRTAALAKATAAVTSSGVLEDIASRTRAMAPLLPRKPGDGAAERIADAMLAQLKPEARPDVARLARTSSAELTATIESSTNVVLVADCRRELALRAEQGDSVATSGAIVAALRLHQLAVEHPETQQRQAVFDHLSATAELINDTLRSVETGAADLGLQYEQAQRIAAERRALPPGDPRLRQPNAIPDPDAR